MKILTIFDPHGQSNYIPTDEEIEAVDKVVFGGDYWDSFTIHPSTQIRIFQKIIKIKEKYGDKIELILGNHDVQYLYNDWVSKLKCSGFSSEYFVRINVMMKHHKDMYVNAWQYTNPDTNEVHLFTHAGVTTFITDALNERYPDAYQDVLDGNMELSELLNGTQMDELYYIGKINGGHDPYSGIFWVRPSQLDKYQIEGYTQHVGHTHIDGVLDKYLESKTLNYYDGLGKHVIEI